MEEEAGIAKNEDKLSSLPFSFVWSMLLDLPRINIVLGRKIIILNVCYPQLFGINGCFMDSFLIVGKMVYLSGQEDKNTLFNSVLA